MSCSSMPEWHALTALMQTRTVNMISCCPTRSAVLLLPNSDDLAYHVHGIKAASDEHAAVQLHSMRE